MHAYIHIYKHIRRKYAKLDGDVVDDDVVDDDDGNITNALICFISFSGPFFKGFQ